LEIAQSILVQRGIRGMPEMCGVKGPVHGGIHFSSNGDKSAARN